MHKRGITTAILAAGMAMSNLVWAMDTARYQSLARQTIHEAEGGFVVNVDRLMATQDKLIQLGIQGSMQYMREHPEHVELLSLVIENAENMKQMSLDEIEAQWHEGGFLKSRGFDLEKMDHFGELFSLMDAIIHPATSYICFKQYKRTKDAALLARANGELIEVIEHVAHLEPDHGEEADHTRLTQTH